MSVSPEMMKSVSSMMSSMSPEVMQSMMAMASSSGVAAGAPATSAGPAGQQFAPGDLSCCCIGIPTPHTLLVWHLHRKQDSVCGCALSALSAFVELVSSALTTASALVYRQSLRDAGQLHASIVNAEV